jgi:hypothetical protein
MGYLDAHLVADQPPRSGDYLAPVDSPDRHVLTRSAWRQRVTLAGDGLDDFQGEEAECFVGAAMKGFNVAITRQPQWADVTTLNRELGNSPGRNRYLVDHAAHAVTSLGTTRFVVTSFGMGNQRRASASFSRRSSTVSAKEALDANSRWASSR